MIAHAQSELNRPRAKYDLQSMLDSLSAYCDKWSLCVNTKKSKVMVFGGGRLDAGVQFTYVQGA